MIVAFGALTACGVLLGFDDPPSPPPIAEDGGPARDASGNTSIDAPTDANDPRSCGVGHRDCLGGGCIAGMCQPFALASNEDEPSGLAVHDGRVFWANHAGNAIRTCTPPCAVVETLVVTPKPLHVAADASGVYWSSTDANVLLHCPLGGCTSGRILRAGSDNPTSIFLKPPALYMASGDFGDVYACRLDGSGCSAVLTPITPLGGVGGIVVSETSVFLAETGSNAIVWCATGSTCSPTSSPKRLVTTPKPLQLSVHEGKIYWTSGGGELGVCAEAGCDAGTVLTSAEIDPVGLAVDATGAYWTSGAGGTVRSTALTGGPARVIASGQNDPFTIALDPHGIYWTNRKGGHVMMVVK